MDSIIQAIGDWLKEVLVAGIMSNLNNTFDSVNYQVGQIATEVGMTPSSFFPAVFNMIRNLSENVIMPIAGILLVKELAVALGITPSYIIDGIVAVTYEEETEVLISLFNSINGEEVRKIAIEQLRLLTRLHSQQ